VPQRIEIERFLDGNIWYGGYRKASCRTRPLSRKAASYHSEFNRQGGRTGLVGQNVVDSAIFLDNSDPSQGNLFLERAKSARAFSSSYRNIRCPPKTPRSRQSIGTAWRWISIAGWHTGFTSSPVPPTFVTGIEGSVRMDHFRPTFIANVAQQGPMCPNAG
jgi:hypothetical protein